MKIAFQTKVPRRAPFFLDTLCLHSQSFFNTYHHINRYLTPDAWRLTRYHNQCQYRSPWNFLHRSSIASFKHHSHIIPTKSIRQTRVIATQWSCLFFPSETPRIGCPIIQKISLHACISPSPNPNSAWPSDQRPRICSNSRSNHYLPKRRPIGKIPPLQNLGGDPQVRWLDSLLSFSADISLGAESIRRVVFVVKLLVGSICHPFTPQDLGQYKNYTPIRNRRLPLRIIAFKIPSKQRGNSQKMKE